MVPLGLGNYTSFEVAEYTATCAERGWVRPTVYQARYNAISKSFTRVTEHILRKVLYLRDGIDKPATSKQNSSFAVAATAKNYRLQPARWRQSIRASTSPARQSPTKDASVTKTPPALSIGSDT